MKIHITRDPKDMLLRVRTQSLSAARADLFHVVYPGSTWKGWSYEALWDMGTGDHTIKVPRPEEKEQEPVEGLAE